MSEANRGFLFFFFRLQESVHCRHWTCSVGLTQIFTQYHTYQERCLFQMQIKKKKIPITNTQTDSLSGTQTKYNFIYKYLLYLYILFIYPQSDQSDNKKNLQQRKWQSLSVQSVSLSIPVVVVLSRLCCPLYSTQGFPLCSQHRGPFSLLCRTVFPIK